MADAQPRVDDGIAPGRPHADWLAITLTYLAAMALFFRGVLASGFDRGFGDRADGIIEVSLLEHWRNVLAGASAWDATNHFHPHVATLGYNDGYFLYGLVYAFWRLFADPLLADTLNLATFKTIGFIAAYTLVARTLRQGCAAGLLVAILFTNANGLMVQAVHAQLQSVVLLPVAMLLVIAIVRAERNDRRVVACVRATALALLMAAWLLTAFYMAWFTIFFAAIFVACWLVVSGRWRPAALWRLLVRHHTVIGVGAMTFALALIPFLHVYLAKARETGGHGYDAAVGYLVLPLDQVNVGAFNTLWGWLVRLLPGAMPGGEHVTGIAPLLFVLGVTALWRVLARGREDAVLCAFAVAIVVCWLLTLRIGDFSLWALVHDYVPGATGLRVVARFQLFLFLPLVLLTVVGWRDRAQAWAVRRPRLLAIAVALLLSEQFGSDVPVQLSRRTDGAALSSVPRPPAPCHSFYVVTARRDEPLYIDAASTALYPHNVDAMLLAELWRVPTINGLSTFNPPDWAFADPRAGDYDARVAAYAAHHRLRGLCRLDMAQAHPWTVVP